MNACFVLGAKEGGKSPIKVLKTNLMLEKITIGDNAILKDVALHYNMIVGPPLAISVGASAKLDLNLGGDWVKFTGKLSLITRGAEKIFGLDFSMKTFVVSAFGINALSFGRLHLAARVGSAPGGVYLDKLQIGGQLCLGDPETCRTLSQTSHNAPEGPKRLVCAIILGRRLLILTRT